MSAGGLMGEPRPAALDRSHPTDTRDGLLNNLRAGPALSPGSSDSTALSRQPYGLCWAAVPVSDVSGLCALIALENRSANVI